MLTFSLLFRLFFRVPVLFVLALLLCLLFVQRAGTASVNLTWNPNTEPDIAGYKVYYGKASGTYESVVDLGNQTAFNLSNLEDGKTYYFVVTAYNILGKESDFSTELRYPEPFSLTIPLSTGLNLISLPFEPLNPSISTLTEKLSPCLLQVLAYTKDAQGYDTQLYYDPSWPDQSTLSTMEAGKGYWIDMACPAEMTVAGNRATKSVPLTVGLNLVGYSSLTPLQVSEALASIAGMYTMIWAYGNDEWLFYDPTDLAGSTLKELTPGDGYWIEAIEETTWTLPSVMTISLSTGLNLISLPFEPLNPSISALTEKLSPCLLQVLAYTKDAQGYDTQLYYDPSWPDQSTLSTMEAGKGYWVDMACPSEMTMVGNRTANPIPLIPGLNLVGYNSLTPLPVSEALSSIANKYTFVWGYKDDQWTYYDPSDQAGSTLQVLIPGSGYWIEATEETTWVLP